MPRRPVVALWRTSALAVALLAAACGQTRPSQAPSAPPAKPVLAQIISRPLTVRGHGFRPEEHVRLVARGLRSQTVETDADGHGAFTAIFRHVKPCDSITVTATGSKGSRAEFNLSQIVCTGT
jgi:hypothetical protein